LLAVSAKRRRCTNTARYLCHVATAKHSVAYPLGGHHGANTFSVCKGSIMVYLLRVLDPTVVTILLVPVCIAIAALALRVACSFAAVNPPEFLQSALTVILIGVANAALSFFLHVTQASPGIGTHLVAPLLTTAAAIALTVKTEPLSAIITTISFVLICGGVFYSLAVINAAMVAKLLA